MSGGGSGTHVVGEEPKDLGGYWLGTEERQNLSITASALRQSIVQVADSHPAELKAMQDRFPDAGAHDLIRFLRARDFDVTKSASMLEAHEEWKRKTLPIQYESVSSTLATRKFYVLDDADNAGRPVIYYCLRRFKEAPYNTEDEIKALVYTLEEVAKPKMGLSFEAQQWTVLIDVSGIRSPPLKFLQQLNGVMEANYPERLFRTILFPAPFWLQKMIQGCLTFVAEETQNKFAYVNDVRSLEEFSMMPIDKMGSDLADLARTKQLKK